MSPDSSAAALLRAEQLLAINRPQEALAALGTVLAQEPDNAGALCLAARAELGLNEPESARNLAARAAAAAPAAEWPLRLLALSLVQLKQPQEAYDAARKAVMNAPNVWQTHHALAHVCSAMFGMTSVGYTAARNAIELAPLEPDPHAMLGRVALESGDQNTAEQALREALRLDPNHAMARNDLGRLQLLRKDHFGAADHFAQAAASNVRMEVAAHNIDVALTSVVARLFFWVWILLITLGRIALQLKGTGAVVAGLATLAVLIGLTVWQLRGLVPALRGRLGPYLRLLPHRDRLMTASIGLLVLGMVALAVMCVLPPDWRWSPAIAGGVALIGSRVVLAIRTRKLAR